VLDRRVYGADAGGAPESPETAGEPRPSRRVYVVAAIGDSLTDPKSHGGRYLDVLRRACPESRFDSHGKGGQMVNQMRRRFARDILSDPPVPGRPQYTHVIVFGGVNDLYSDLTAGRTVAKITEDLATMYALAKARGLAVVALTVAPWGGFTRYYNESRGAATRELNAWIHAQPSRGTVDTVVDAHALLACGDAERLCPDYEAPFHDGIHFGKTGHERLGEALRAAAFADCR
jgi:lysophospholipase L1-like esterase